MWLRLNYKDAEQLSRWNNTNAAQVRCSNYGAMFYIYSLLEEIFDPVFKERKTIKTSLFHL